MQEKKLNKPKFFLLKIHIFYESKFRMKFEKERKIESIL